MRARGIKEHLPTVVLVAVFLVGVCLLAYPTVSDWWNQQHASRVVASYQQAVEELDAEQLAALRAEADAYNAELSQRPASYELDDVRAEEYARLLSVNGSDAMGSLSIPRIGVELPIYHGTSDGVLQVGVGHLAGSSLPVGGESTHAVLMGHRGLPSAELLTRLDELAVGDAFSVEVLGETLYSEVDQVLIVEPSDVSALAIEPGEDLCTLVTCTPYGINSHRLLVRGHRVDAPELSTHVTADAVRVEPMLVACALAVPVLVVLAAAVLVRSRRRR